MKVVLVMFKDGERRDFPVTAEKTVIGRRQDSSLRIQTADVSRQHCEIFQNGKEIIVRDLGSSNGTYVNGKRVAEARLMAGDKLSVGPIIFVVQVNGLPPKLTPFDMKIESARTAEAPTPAGKAGEKKKTPLIDDDDETEEILDLEDLDIDEMFADEDDEDDDLGPPKKTSKK